jgi:hypothetical protein
MAGMDGCDTSNICVAVLLVEGWFFIVVVCFQNIYCVDYYTG